MVNGVYVSERKYANFYKMAFKLAAQMTEEIDKAMQNALKKWDAIKIKKVDIGYQFKPKVLLKMDFIDELPDYELLIIGNKIKSLANGEVRKDWDIDEFLRIFS